MHGKDLQGNIRGEYSLMPYYRKVKEYGDLESRDLWEYELALNEQETTFLGAAHLGNEACAISVLFYQ